MFISKTHDFLAISEDILIFVLDFRNCGPIMVFNKFTNDFYVKFKGSLILVKLITL